jgi:hypothetical protein
MINIDYSKYTIDELRDVKNNIDSDKYPERYYAVEKELKVKESMLPLVEDPISKTDYSDDPISKTTRWNPIKSGGANFLTHYLVETSASRLEFKASVGAKLFSLGFIVMGALAACVFITKNISTGKFGYNIETIFPAALGGAFVIAGILMIFFFTIPIVFDKHKGIFWKDRKSPSKLVDKKFLKCFLEFSNIHAIQLITECVTDSDGHYESYEMNLVLKNGDRVNVVDHGDDGQLREDASKLSLFLKVPVWDAIN